MATGQTIDGFPASENQAICIAVQNPPRTPDRLEYKIKQNKIKQYVEE